MLVVAAAVVASALLRRVWSEGASPGSRFSGQSVITVTSFWCEASWSCCCKLGETGGSQCASVADAPGFWRFEWWQQQVVVWN